MLEAEDRFSLMGVRVPAKSTTREGLDMVLLEGNDWVFLNHMVYKINSIDDITEMQKSCLDLIKFLIPYNMATFYLADHSGKHLLCNPVGVNIEEEELIRYIGSHDEVDVKWALSSTKSTVYRETDLIPDSREESSYYKEIYVPKNIHYSIFLTLVHNEVFQGILTLYRSKEALDFTEKDIFVLDMLKDHLSYRLSKETQIPKSVPAVNLSEFMDQYKLTLREFDIFKLLAEGLTNHEISSRLFISTPTLKKHIVNIYKKLHVNNRLQLLKLFR